MSTTSQIPPPESKLYTQLSDVALTQAANRPRGSVYRHSLPVQPVTAHKNASPVYRLKTKRRAKSEPDRCIRLRRGRSYLKPLLGVSRGRRLSYDSRRSRRSSQERSIYAFGEIDFLKCKLGFTLPTAESIVKSASLRPQPKSKLFSLFEASERFSERCRAAGLNTSRSEVRLPKRDNSISQTQVPRVYSSLTSPTNRSRSSVHMARSRAKELSQIEFLLRNMETAVRAVQRRKERAVLHNFDGSVSVHTQAELDSFRLADEKTLKAVKKRLEIDRKKAEKQRQIRLGSIHVHRAPASLGTTGTSANDSCMLAPLDLTTRRSVSLKLVDLFTL